MPELRRRCRERDSRSVAFSEMRCEDLGEGWKREWRDDFNFGREERGGVEVVVCEVQLTSKGDLQRTRMASLPCQFHITLQSKTLIPKTPAPIIPILIPIPSTENYSTVRTPIPPSAPPAHKPPPYQSHHTRHPSMSPNPISPHSPSHPPIKTPLIPIRNSGKGLKIFCCK